MIMGIERLLNVLNRHLASPLSCRPHRPSQAILVGQFVNLKDTLYLHANRDLCLSSYDPSFSKLITR